MKIFFNRCSGKTAWSRMVLMGLCTLLINSCEKDHHPGIKFEFQTNEIIYYPEKRISISFDLLPEESAEQYRITWFNPDSLEEAGPFIINIRENILLDFAFTDSKNTPQRFQYEIIADTIDSLKYDYRNHYTGIYNCDVTYSYQDSVRIYQDTLWVIKNSTFDMINILTRNDIIKNYEGNKMTYLNSNGFYNDPEGTFYGYHSGVTFSKDSIYYGACGPLGFFYCNDYEGIKIGQ